LVGILFAIASLYKTVVIGSVAFLSIFHVAFLPGHAKDRIRPLLEVSTMAIVSVAAWIMVFGYFYAQGGLEDFYGAVFSHGRYYAGSIPTNILRGIAIYFSKKTTLVLAPLLLIAGIGLALSMIGSRRRPWMLLLGYAIGTQLSVSLPGKSWTHYFQLWLPILAVASAWGIEEVGRFTRQHFTRTTFLAGSALLLILIAHELPFFLISPENWARKKYGEIFVATEKAAAEISRILRPDETFYEWGFETGLYFYSRRSPPTGVIDVDPIVGGPLAARLSDRVIKDLEREKPELFILNKNQKKREPELFKWFENHYAYSFDSGPFAFFVLRGGNLKDRLKKLREKT
jgi:hypothetical protein